MVLEPLSNSPEGEDVVRLLREELVVCFAARSSLSFPAFRQKAKISSVSFAPRMTAAAAKIPLFDGSILPHKGRERKTDVREMSWAVAAVGTLCRFILLNSPSYLLRDASIARLAL